MDAIEDIEAFTDAVDAESFRASREKTLAVVKCFEILGDAVKKLPNDLRSQYTQIPWSAIAGMRNILVHEYWGIDTNVTWATVQEGLPSLKEAVIEMTSHLEG